MKIEIGKNIKQIEGYSAFIPVKFPPKNIFNLSKDILQKSAKAERLIGKLDGITHSLPDVDFFLSMFVTKDAASSSQIEGTKATMIDAIEMKEKIAIKDTDADDILHYIKALHYGIKRLEEFPLSLRFIKEIHKQLMTNARASQFSDPGQFRKSQNWIGGTTPVNALFVPPPVDSMNKSLDDFERFLREEKSTAPLIHAALMHAQFETIHPFLDGNGRTGRLLITMILCYRKILERPVLFLSSYFKKNQKAYYQRLREYTEGKIEQWVDFFLDGVIEIVDESIDISQRINKIREEDMRKIEELGKRESESGELVLQKLYSQPIVSVKTITQWTKFSRNGAQKLIDRFIELGILSIKDKKEKYGRTYEYKKYLDVFVLKS